MLDIRKAASKVGGGEKIHAKSEWQGDRARSTHENGRIQEVL